MTSSSNICSHILRTAATEPKAPGARCSPPATTNSDATCTFTICGFSIMSFRNTQAPGGSRIGVRDYERVGCTRREFRASRIAGLLGWFALARDHHTTCLAMLLPILAMGPFRILDGAHWPSDALAGYTLALAWTITVLVIGLPWAGLKHTGSHP
jgi:hypothetical protein